MSHFYSRIKGNKGEATRCGTKQSGLDASVFGWDIGGAVSMRHDTPRNLDIVDIKVTRNNSRNTVVTMSFAVINEQLVCLNNTHPEYLL